MIRSAVRILWCGAALALLAGCARKPDDPSGRTPVSPDSVPPIPRNLGAEVGRSRIDLRWTVNDSTGVTEYSVYRAVGDEDLREIARPAGMRYVDTDVSLGVRYTYRVAAHRGGLEGERSGPVSVTPAVYGIVLEGGTPVTGGNAIESGSRKISVGLTAPSSTASVRLSERADLEGASFQPYVPGAPFAVFTLSGGDGVKRVFGQFEDANGGRSEVVNASIELDTKAIIHSVTEDSGGSILGADDLLHLAAAVDTTGGVVTVAIGSAYTGLRLFDDGTNGDATAFDGRYERDFTIPGGLETVDALVVASFRDPVGNQAAPISAATRVTIADPPGPVSFDGGASRLLGAGILLFWNQNGDADFSRYRIYRAAGTSVGEGDPIVAEITNRDSLSFADRRLVGGATYTWGIQTLDERGFQSGLGTLTRTVAYDPELVGGIVSPPAGSTSTVFEYSCIYRHAGGVAPSFVRVIVDGNQVFSMTKVGSGTDWVGGETYRVTALLAAGGHTYFFEAEAVDGSTGRNPATPGLVLGGPSVVP